MTKTNRKSHRLIVLIAAGSVALGSATFGIGTSPGSSRGAGFGTSPGRGALASTMQKQSNQANEGTIQKMGLRKAGKGQQEY